MGNILTSFVAVLVVAHILIFSAASPAVSLSVELAKKCREMAVKAHPMTLPGTKPYAAAEREFFRVCVSKNGDMSNTDSEKGPPPGQQ
jgi:hypothetical protein